MGREPVAIHWPNGNRTTAAPGSSWLAAAQAAGFAIPTGCLGGSCGACEIEVNGKVVRTCIATVPPKSALSVELASDPYW
ncbi:MAG: 2Fe-2S iron-sulfur cluster binding domain-containing protein [Cyanobium sp. M30B3]|nr:MAG: 2Fe-2S iron-sulfur cluster binding domain-containing protein [Cyanobium sp. M30B3]